MAEKRSDKRTLFINDSDERIESLRIAYELARERYMKSPSISNGSKMWDALNAYEDARSTSAARSQIVWLDENGTPIP